MPRKPKKSCNVCTKPDSDRMVACDKCQRWYHFECVQVGDSVAERSWFCPLCDIDKTAEATTMNLRKDDDSKSRISQASTSASVKAAKAALELQRLEEVKQLEMKRINNELDQQMQEAELERKRLEEERKKREEEHALEKTQIEIAKRQQEALKKLEEMYLAEKYKILHAQIDETSSQRSVLSCSRKSRTDEWIERLPVIPNPVTTDKPLMHPSSEDKIPKNGPENKGNQAVTHIPVQKPSVLPREYSTPIMRNRANDGQHGFPNESTINPEIALQNQEGCSERNRVSNEQWNTVSNRVLTNAQIAARQAFPKDLPTFTGNPEEWPVFFRCFENISQECGLSNTENLIRLQRSLKGEALEAVRSHLLEPEMVPCVIETLQMLYGRPEILLSSLLAKIRNTPAPREGKLETLIMYGLAVQNYCNHIKAVKLEEHFSNPMLLHELLEKLPSEYKMKWADYKDGAQAVDLKLFGQFMHEIVRKASTVTFPSSFKTTKPEENRIRGGAMKPKGYLHHSDTKSSEYKGGQSRTVKVCPACEKSGHDVELCGKFVSLSADERWQVVRLHNLCKSCLKDHNPWSCRRPKECSAEGCRVRHHPWLHLPPSGPSPQNYHRVNSSIIYRIIPVTIYNGSKSIDTFALFDEASEVTMIETNLAESLNLGGTLDPLHLKWTGNVTRVEENSRTVDVAISAKRKLKKFTLKNARTVEKLELPIQSIDSKSLAENYHHLRGLPIADYDCARPQILIGLENIYLRTPLKVREGVQGHPTATKTRLGWCVYGGVSAQLNFNLHHTVLSGAAEEDRTLYELVKEYVMIDNIGVVVSPTTLESKEEQRARTLLESTTRRISGGFETGLLWKTDDIKLPDSYPMAETRLRCLEKKIYKDSRLVKRVKNQIADYLAKGYAHKTTPSELSSADPAKVWYLPLGIVTNPKKPEKLRLIWDASARVQNISFNSMMLKGPDLLSSLPAVLYRFRTRRVAICGDLKEMFHQIKIKEDDKSAQRFLWRDNPSDKPTIYTMDVATFGAACSPCSAQYVKNINAYEHEQQFPAAVEAIVYGHYVDDYLDSRDNEEEIIKLIKEVKFVHQQGGFEIRNFLSNSAYVLTEIGGEDFPETKDLNLTVQMKSQSVLGIKWLPESDLFTFTLNLPSLDPAVLDGSIRPTKRQILRTVMSLYDPLGMLAAFIIHGKIVIQSLWKLGCMWDEQIDNSSFFYWKRWTSMFCHLGDIRIPRAYFNTAIPENCHPIQLHTFVDASEEAYACAAYFRFYERGAPHCVLVGAKAKVAPVKPLSIPRLELQAAILGIRLADFIQRNHQLSIAKRFFWTDSATVLHWIHSDARKYNAYVACRIGEILTSTEIAEWKWVPTKNNVADEATKWGQGPCFNVNSRWFRGPEFLWDHLESWPEQKWKPSNENEEMRSTCLHHQRALELIIDIARFSKWERLLRTVAYMFRFGMPRKTADRPIGVKPLEYLEQQYLKQAELALFRIAQRESFPDELAVFERSRNGKPAGVVPITSPLYKLSAFISEEGVVKMDGRIGAAPNLPIEAKYPIILAKTHPLTFLIVDYYHRQFLHHNAETVFNELRQRFYVPGMRRLIRTVASRCQWCKVYNKYPVQPKMAPLPRARLVAFQRPFSYVGLDYFGPLMVKVGRSHVKRWVALFTCLTTRAIHMEVAHSLSTISCKMCIRRFIARRGAPIEIYSDNGTNFRGAANELRAQLQDINQQCATSFTNANTKW
ncbi:uncharacterized protein LOC129742402 [Uranotaenia lowii]|uniref:uncharacterized protein LOC129742402 n=1 Tax=Uranotaenia lowii TaxID=190385 RepID=UPI002478D39F|nr:uncharacterized protein LOC129742402 [Uranotaenia lowii]